MRVAEPVPTTAPIPGITPAASREAAGRLLRKSTNLRANSPVAMPAPQARPTARSANKPRTVVAGGHAASPPKASPPGEDKVLRLAPIRPGSPALTRGSGVGFNQVLRRLVYRRTLPGDEIPGWIELPVEPHPPCDLGVGVVHLPPLDFRAGPPHPLRQFAAVAHGLKTHIPRPGVRYPHRQVAGTVALRTGKVDGPRRPALQPVAPRRQGPGKSDPEKRRQLCLDAGTFGQGPFDGAHRRVDRLADFHCLRAVPGQLGYNSLEAQRHQDHCDATQI